MSSESLPEFDIKMLILKRWNLDQTKRLFETKSNRGQYIAFHGYHFIEVISSDKESTLSDIYRTSRNTPPKFEIFSDIHTVQSMTLISDDRYEDFWNSNTQLMGITFMQLTDSTQWDYDRIKNRLAKIFDKKSKWALYYSLDFCDLVLFAKNISLNHYNDILWRLSLIREKEFKVICDTFTIFCFDAIFLRNSFMRFEAPKIRDATVDRISKVSLKLDEAKLLVKDNPHDPTILRRLYAIERQYQHREILLKKQDALLTIIEKTPIWSDKLSLSVNLSIKNVASLFDLLDKLEEYHIPHKEYRLPGRYDVNILIEDISGQQAICVLYLIDQQTSSEKDTEKLQAIGNYEVIFLASSWGGKRRLRFIPPSQQEFEKNINNKLLTLLGSINLPQNEFMEYIQETLRATRELTNTGFSEEFILSVYPSFITYLELMNEVEGFLSNRAILSHDVADKIIKSRDSLSKSYFTALNTVTLCTMHSERQFIHAPSFNADYFEIPPKLLAFYSAFVNNISEAVSHDSLYYYMITPDYRSDINVLPLHIDYEEDTLRHIAIIHLPERFFYDPQSAMMLLSHEVAHYEGNRKRELRAQSIFHLIGMFLLLETKLFPLEDHTDKIITNTTLLGALSYELGDYIFERFQKQGNKPNRGIQFHLSDISDFLLEIDYGLYLFFQKETRHEIAYRWKYCLKSVNFYDSEQLNAVRLILNYCDQKENSSYFSSLCDIDKIDSSFEPLSQFLSEELFEVANASLPEDASVFVQKCEMVIQTFSESFADMQMFRILGECFSFAQYKKLILEINNIDTVDVQEVKNDLTVEQIVRYNALCAVFNLNMNDRAFLSDYIPVNTIIDSVSNYLKVCLQHEEKFIHTDPLYMSFYEADPFMQCMLLNRALHEYKEDLTYRYTEETN